MAITLRSRREVDLIRKAGVVVGSVLSQLEEMARPGVSTAAVPIATANRQASINGSP